MIERSAFSISLIKIFGYKMGEIRKIYLSIFVRVIILYFIINKLLVGELKNVMLAIVLKDRE
ncbi:hypothetical protein ACER0A_005445 [Haloimpatiens sp. FM7315]|uniref:hypothetical protein n=1 Tax=Haloimpatiens sp. FM7315 TaxID=3298609 RepID=UPI0035A2D317